MSRRPDLGLLRLALVVAGGRRFWLLALLPLLWLLFQAGVLLAGAGEAFGESSAQGTLIGLPLTLLAVFLGIRIISGWPAPVWALPPWSGRYVPILTVPRLGASGKETRVNARFRKRLNIYNSPSWTYDPISGPAVVAAGPRGWRAGRRSSPRASPCSLAPADRRRLPA